MKFKSVLVKEETVDPKTGKVRPGVTAWIPVDDHAKLSQISQNARDLGVWKPEEGELDAIRLKQQKAKLEDLKRRGLTK